MDRDDIIRQIGETVFYQGSPSKISRQHAEVLADFILRHTEELTEEVKKGMKQALINEELRKENEELKMCLEVDGEKMTDLIDTRKELEEENDRLKALVDSVQDTLKDMKRFNDNCGDNVDKRKMCNEFEARMDEALAKIAEFKEGNK